VADSDYDIATYGENYAPVYDTWYPEVLPHDPQLDVLANRSGGRLLELGIGTGRVALPLARRGVKVHGIDASAAMLAELRKKPGGELVTTVLGDFADVAADERFPLICCLKNTFFMLTTQEDQTRCVRNAARALEAEGVLVLETFMPDPSRFDAGQRLCVKQMRTGAALIQTSVHDRTAQVVTSQDIALTARGVEVYPLKTRYVWPSELDLMAQVAGMRLVERWDGWTGVPWSERTTNIVSFYERTPSGD
jgi:SAM-dependent methyltransferase